MPESPAAKPASEAPWVQFTIPSASCEDRVEEIYEDLCYVKFTSAMPEVAYRLVVNFLSTFWSIESAVVGLEQFCINAITN